MELVGPGSLDFSAPAEIQPSQYSVTGAYELASDFSNPLYFKVICPDSGSIRIDCLLSTTAEGTNSETEFRPLASVTLAGGGNAWNFYKDLSDPATGRTDQLWRVQAGDELIFQGLGVPYVSPDFSTITFGPMNVVVRVSQILDGVGDDHHVEYVSDFSAGSAGAPISQSDVPLPFDLDWDFAFGSDGLIEYSDVNVLPGRPFSAHHMEGLSSTVWFASAPYGDPGADPPRLQYWPSEAFKYSEVLFHKAEVSTWMRIDDGHDPRTFLPDMIPFTTGAGPHTELDDERTSIISFATVISLPDVENGNLWMKVETSYSEGDPPTPVQIDTGVPAMIDGVGQWFRTLYRADFEAQTMTAELYTEDGLQYSHTFTDYSMPPRAPGLIQGTYQPEITWWYNSGVSVGEYKGVFDYYDYPLPALEPPPLSGIAGLQDINRARFTGRGQ